MQSFLLKVILNKNFGQVFLASILLITLYSCAQGQVITSGTQGPILSSTIKAPVLNNNQSFPLANERANSGKSYGSVINYVWGNEVVGDTNPNYASWNPYIYINRDYHINDTDGDDIFANYISVAYDTMWDVYTNSYDTVVGAGSVSVDTMWFVFDFHNTSGISDTIIANICGVTAEGFPSASPVYGSDTMIMPPRSSFFGGYSLDTIYEGWFVPKTPIAIPANARHGWNFCDNLQFIGSKLDTFGIQFNSWYAGCKKDFYVCNAYTLMGVPDGSAPAVNSWVTGLYWYNDTKNQGNNTQMTWPTTSGTHPGTCTNGTVTFYPNFPQPSDSCTDSSFFKVQDIWLSASVKYSTTAGINTLAATANNLSIYPNPSSGQFTIKLQNKQTDYLLQVYNIMGEEIYQSVMNNSQNTVNLSSQPDGMYFIYLKSDEGVEIGKVLLTK